MGKMDNVVKKSPFGRKSKKFSREQLIHAVTKTRGLVYLAAQGLGCTPQLIFKRAVQDPELKQLIHDERNRIIDFAEAKLVEAVGKGEAWAVCFLLKTQGRRRGYSERVELEDLRREVEFLRHEVSTAIGTGQGAEIKIEIKDQIGYPELPC